VNTGESVADCRQKRQNGKFCSHVSGRAACPIDLWISKTKTVVGEVSGNRSDIALPPAPAINVRLIDQNEPQRDG
jgi:hypothetical protein